jgi:putative ABC transport system substrate-binding protein
MDTVVEFCRQNNIPLFSSDVDSVKKGTIAARGIDYYKLGQHTGDMAVDVLLNGKAIGEIPQLKETETEVIYNSDAAGRVGVTLPESILQQGKEVNS